VWAMAGAAVAGLHYDMADNMLSVLTGEKEVLLFRPAEVINLHHEHVTDATLGGEPPGQSEPQPTKPQASARPLEAHLRPDARYKSYAHASGVTCTVRAGEALFIPAFWHHAVHSRGAEAGHCLSLSVNFWFEARLFHQRATARHPLPSRAELR
ncbi:unnamed protein product, partial [Polarella glacialis]